MRNFILGALTAIVVLALAAFSYFSMGFAPVATNSSPMLFEHYLAKAALHARIRREMPQAVPLVADESNLFEGARIYQSNCAVCHGLPSQSASSIARGMFPKPPQLFLKTVSNDPPGEIYWKTKNGIRLTGMPAFGGALSETQLWQVALLLKQGDHLPTATNALLAKGRAEDVAVPDESTHATRSTLATGEQITPSIPPLK